MDAVHADKDGVRSACRIVHFLIPVVDIVGLTARCCVARAGSAATEVPFPIFVVVAVYALDSRQYLIRWTPEVNRRVPVVHITGPVAVFERESERGHLTASKPESAIFAAVAMHAFDARYRFVSFALKVEFPIEVIVVILLQVSWTIYMCTCTHTCPEIN